MTAYETAREKMTRPIGAFPACCAGLRQRKQESETRYCGASGEKTVKKRLRSHCWRETPAVCKRIESEHPAAVANLLRRRQQDDTLLRVRAQDEHLALDAPKIDERKIMQQIAWRPISSSG